MFWTIILCTTVKKFDNKMTTNKLIFVKLPSFHDYYFLDNNYNRINQMYLCANINEFSAIVYVFYSKLNVGLITT